MIVRIFRATPKADKLRDYEKLLVEKTIPSMRRTSGCLHAKVLKSLGVVREVLFISEWDSLDSVKSFAGEDWHNPVLIGDEAQMIEGSAEVKHYHIIDEF